MEGGREGREGGREGEREREGGRGGGREGGKIQFPYSFSIQTCIVHTLSVHLLALKEID